MLVVYTLEYLLLMLCHVSSQRINNHVQSSKRRSSILGNLQRANSWEGFSNPASDANNLPYMMRNYKNFIDQRIGQQKRHFDPSNPYSNQVKDPSMSRNWFPSMNRNLMEQARLDNVRYEDEESWKNGRPPISRMNPRNEYNSNPKAEDLIKLFQNMSETSQWAVFRNILDKEKETYPHTAPYYEQTYKKPGEYPSNSFLKFEKSDSKNECNRPPTLEQCLYIFPSIQDSPITKRPHNLQNDEEPICKKLERQFATVMKPLLDCRCHQKFMYFILVNTLVFCSVVIICFGCLLYLYSKFDSPDFRNDMKC